ncbi:MAG: hypothetical protein B7Z66_05735 [Chromatiales bacterium 21-64-14]|nr:MAG: hypothetical protein B7Z66_05735 [Chromatiales bacterium 21-64-14]HQU15197.1 CUAEP/CCAEP-tail radical SAM protein [Gammaproteobacteria bacterium]
MPQRPLRQPDSPTQPTATGCRVVLISPYELGRQPFALAQPAAWLNTAGLEVACLDLSLQRLEPQVLAGAKLVALYLGMHTATRIAVEALPRIRALAPDAHLCAYGLYAPVNAGLLHRLGIDTILGGECEPRLLALAQAVQEGRRPAADPTPMVDLGKIEFRTPDRSGLPPLKRYTHLMLPDGATRVVGFAEASRGCKHLCRHCPVVPVYQGRFRVVSMDVVLDDIRQQVAAGAQHISFGDPDFLNGPTHARKLVHALHREFPELTYDATIKIQHLIDNAALLPELRQTGCLFITSAVESVDDEVLKHLDKHHSGADLDRAVALLESAGIALAPTFVPFTPWTSLEGYVTLLRRLVALRLVESVPPVQLSIRLLVPEGSHLLKIPGFRARLGDFEPEILGYPWRHEDARVDTLQEAVQDWAAQAEGQGLARGAVFLRIWELAHAALGTPAPALPERGFGTAIPRLSEAWYCCAEPTRQQLRSF